MTGTAAAQEPADSSTTSGGGGIRTLPGAPQARPANPTSAEGSNPRAVWALQRRGRDSNRPRRRRGQNLNGEGSNPRTVGALTAEGAGFEPSRARHRRDQPIRPLPRGESSGGLGPTAEGEGFEPSVEHKPHNGFRDRPVQPLRHPSERPTSRGPGDNIGDRRSSGLPVRRRALGTASRSRCMRRSRRWLRQAVSCRRPSARPG